MRGMHSYLRFTPLLCYSCLQLWQSRRTRTLDQPVKHASLRLQGDRPCVHVCRQFLRIEVSVPSASSFVGGFKRGLPVRSAELIHRGLYSA
jgi:hypothetical protein